MAQKFTSLDDAAAQLSISKERLNQLREANAVRAYRDGASWKFRSEDIDRMAEEGIPQIDPGASDLSLDTSDLDLSTGSGLKLSHDEPTTKSDAVKASESELGLADEALEPGSASDLSTDDVDEPTVAGLDEGSDDALALDTDDSIDINKDSILLSEAELGGSMGRPPSTIIGKSELDLDADLDLSPLDKGAGPASDVRLAADSGLMLHGDDDVGLDLPTPSGNFAGLDELEVDLEAESSRILSPEDVAKAQAAAKSSGKGAKGPTGLSDLGLAPLDSSPAVGASDVHVASAASSGSLTGLSALELDDDDDDEVLGDASGSDVTLSGGSSGINIISPSDSGLALDEVPLDLSGSAPIGSSLDLGSMAEDLSLEPLDLGGAGPESKVGEDFQLTPIGEDDGDDEKDSSQVIALDELSEESAGTPLASGFGEHAVMSEDFALGGLTPGAAPVGVGAAAVDLPFSIWNVMGLAGCMLMLMLCGMMTFDLLRNMWSWEGVSTINSSLLEVLNPFIGR